jgi:hypothetical protein
VEWDAQGAGHQELLLMELSGTLLSWPQSGHSNRPTASSGRLASVWMLRRLIGTELG